MTRREAWLTALGIFVVALVVRVVAAAAIGFPKPEDTAYYVGVARNLVEGRGLVSDALWSYGTPPLHLPAPGVRGLAAAARRSSPRSRSRCSRARHRSRWRRRCGPRRSCPCWPASILAVLAWRLAADVADERRLPAGRARTLAIGRA